MGIDLSVVHSRSRAVFVIGRRSSRAPLPAELVRCAAVWAPTSLQSRLAGHRSAPPRRGGGPGEPRISIRTSRLSRRGAQRLATLKPRVQGRSLCRSARLGEEAFETGLASTFGASVGSVAFPNRHDGRSAHARR
jgi:hypothetical protein